MVHGIALIYAWGIHLLVEKLMGEKLLFLKNTLKTPDACLSTDSGYEEPRIFE